MAFEDFDRTAGIGGSDIPAILGVSPYATPTDVWLEKTHHPSWQPKKVSPEMRFGTLLEPVLRAAYAEDRSTVVHATGEKTYWADDHIRYAHLDGLIANEGIWEGKCPFQTYRNWTDGPPVYVHAQIQHYMDITGEPFCDVSALAAGLDPIFQTFRIPADPVAQEHIRTAALRFWNDHVLTGFPPAALPAALEFPTHIGDLMVTADGEAETLAMSLFEAKGNTAEAEADADALKEALKKKIGKAAGMVGDGWRIRWKKNADSSKTDWKLVAGIWRKQIEEALGADDPGEALRLLADSAPPDTIVSLYTTTQPGARPFVLEERKSE